MTRGRPSYPTTICILEPRACPNDSQFEHDGYLGCVPRDFSSTTGKSKTHRQSRMATEDGPRWLWDGGCDAFGAES